MKIKIMTESQINVHGISPNAVNDIGPNDFVNNYHQVFSSDIVFTL